MQRNEEMCIYTGNKVSRYCPWGSPDFALTTQTLQISYFKCIQRTKETHV